MSVFKNILVTLDGSATDEKTMLYALSISKHYEAKLWLVHVLDLNHYMSDFEQVSGSGYLPAEIKEAGQAILNKALALVKDKTGNIEALLKIGIPQEKILQTAVEESIDLIIMNSRGLGAVKQLLLGSVSQYIINHAKIPVLIIR